MENDDTELKVETVRSSTGMKVSIVVILILGIAITMYAKRQKQKRAESVPAPIAATAAALPRLVDLGAGKCIPCKAMAPILEELKKTYAGKLDVVFIDVWENPTEAEKYKIDLIPTQVFFAADGKELFRHEGFFSREDILAKWKEFGHVF
jgi:thioredoxin 1